MKNLALPAFALVALLAPLNPIGVTDLVGVAQAQFTHPVGSAPPPPPPPPPTDAFAACLLTMSPNSWKSANTCASSGHATVRSVAWSCSAQPCSSNGQPGVPADAPTNAQLVGSSDVGGITTDWGGGLYNITDNFMMVWGGGHQGYYGNEIYGYKIANLDWQRLSVPSSMNTFVKGGAAEVLPDGNPVAGHTYSGLQYSTVSGDLVQMGTCGEDDGGCAELSWKQKFSGLSPTSYNHWGSIAIIDFVLPGQNSGYDPNTGRVYSWGGFESRALAFLASPYTGSWVSSGGSAAGNTSASTAAVQPGQQMIAIGPGAGQGGTTNFIAANLTTGALITSTATGDTSATSCASAPGFAYDPTANVFVGWCGGATVSVLNPTTYNWVAHNGTGTTPTCSSAGHCTGATGTMVNGTFGRFQCLQPKYNACVLVNSVEDPLFIYKPDF